MCIKFWWRVKKNTTIKRKSITLGTRQKSSFQRYQRCELSKNKCNTRPIVAHFQYISSTKQKKNAETQTREKQDREAHRYFPENWTTTVRYDGVREKALQSVTTEKVVDKGQEFGTRWKSIFPHTGLSVIFTYNLKEWKAKFIVSATEGKGPELFYQTDTVRCSS